MEVVTNTHFAGANSVLEFSTNLEDRMKLLKAMVGEVKILGSSYVLLDAFH